MFMLPTFLINGINLVSTAADAGCYVTNSKSSPHHVLLGIKGSVM